jgi:hypothetical protein
MMLRSSTYAGHEYALIIVWSLWNAETDGLSRSSMPNPVIPSQRSGLIGTQPISDAAINALNLSIPIIRIGATASGNLLRFVLTPAREWSLAQQ